MVRDQEDEEEKVRWRVDAEVRLRMEAAAATSQQDSGAQAALQVRSTAAAAAAAGGNSLLACSPDFLHESQDCDREAVVSCPICLAVERSQQPQHGTAKVWCNSRI